MKIFPPDDLAHLASRFIEDGPHGDLGSLVAGRRFVVAYLDAASEWADLALSVETQVFAEVFSLSPDQVTQDYGRYDEVSTFVAVIDMEGHVPRPAAALRMISYRADLGFKDVNDLVVDLPDNPWREEIRRELFSSDESYEASTAWNRLVEATGATLDLARSLDVATHAAAPGYRGQNGAMDGASMLLYHSCLRYALAHEIESLVAIFDLPPFQNLQQFGSPFSTYRGLQPHPYGGPYDTIPAYCIISEGIQRIRDYDELVGAVFVDGVTLADLAVLPAEYDPGTYSNAAVGLT